MSEAGRQRTREFAWRLVLPLALLAVWYVLTEILALFHPTLLPSPLAVFRQLVRLINNGELRQHIEASLLRIFYANCAALGLGVPLGLAMGLYRPVERLFDGLLSIFRPIPPLAWVPLAILWLGIGTLSVVFITFLSAFFAVLLNTLAGARGCSRSSRPLPRSSPPAPRCCPISIARPRSRRATGRARRAGKPARPRRPRCARRPMRWRRAIRRRPSASTRRSRCRARRPRTAIR
jgi:hypothetical protein